MKFFPEYFICRAGYGKYLKGKLFLGREMIMANGRLAPDLPLPAQTLGGTPLAQQTDRQLLEAFTRHGDGAAFEALVQRHGGMVLGVCRRVLDHAHDAEDAFQATFLVLVRKAQAVQNPELLGNWLYGVAYRTARKAKLQTARRGHYERRAASMLKSSPSPELLDQELRSNLDEEIQRLPSKYRQPLVLCYLQGMTNEEAARKLGWPAGSMSYRLARARELLGVRLKQRNQAMPAGMLALFLTRQTGAEQVPAPLVNSTVEAALSLAGAKAVAGIVISSSVKALTDAIVQSMDAARRKIAALLFLILLLLGMGFGLVAYGFWGDANNGFGSFQGQSGGSATGGSTTGCCGNKK
jgi:RNA polymerase sigma-70 factor (ECF subfamily)